MSYLSLRVELRGAPMLTFVAPSSQFCIGSSAEAELLLVDAMIEPLHARIFNLLNTWWIEPASSSAVILGTNRRRIRDASPLVLDEPIRIGPFAIRPRLAARGVNRLARRLASYRPGTR